MRTYNHFADLLNEIPVIPADSIISRTLFSSDEVKVVLFGFAAGQELSEHTAAKPAVIHFLKGEAHLALGDDNMEAGPGTWVHMPAHLPHSVEAVTEVVMLLLLLQ